MVSKFNTMFDINSLPSLDGKTFLVTGGNTGIGYATCLKLVALHARVYMTARSQSKATIAIAEIKSKHPQADIHYLICDHTRLSTVVNVVETFKSREKHLHGLILNAGVMAVPYEITVDGFESQIQINYLAHWLLTHHLTPILLSTSRIFGPGSVRVACVSSHGHRQMWGVKGMIYDEAELRQFGDFGRYGHSKLANVIHAKVLNEQYGPDSESARTGQGEIWAASLHPGFIDSQLNEMTSDRAGWKWKWLHPVLRWTGTMRGWDEGCVASLFVTASLDFTKDMCGMYFDEKAKETWVYSSALQVEERTVLESWTVRVMTAGRWIS